MKKFLVVVVLLVAVGGGGAAFWFFGQVYVKSQVKTRVKELFDRVDGFRAGFSVQEYEIVKFFDEQNYDPQAMTPNQWVEKWRYENGLSYLRRMLREVEYIKCTKTEAEVEFIVDEGDPGDKKKNIPPDMTPYRYHAVLVLDPEKDLWLFRSLQPLSE